MGSIHTVKEEGKRTWRNHAPELAMTSLLENLTEPNVIIISVMLFHKPLVLSFYRPPKLEKTPTPFYREGGRHSLGVCKEGWCRTTVKNMEGFTHAVFVFALYYMDFNLF